jgi:signal transduction histidine kinase
VQWESLPGLKSISVNCVADQIKQVFLNISMNAIEAMQPGGGKLFVDMVLSPPSDQTGIVFRDTGPGITPEIRANLFEPFVTTKSSGLGLGLSISYEIVQRHGGRITVDSLPGQGTVFTVWLPLGIEQ